MPVCGAFAEPSGDRDPPTSSLPWHFCGNRSQPTRRRLGGARPQPGWWLDLDGPYPLATSLTLGQLRARAEVVRGVLDALEARHLRPLYFPFFFYGGGELRPMQPYLNKLPADLVSALPELAAAAAIATAPPGPTPAAARMQPVPERRDFGAPYRRAQARGLPDEREPFAVDPAVVERGLSGHVDTQNAVADAAAAGIAPRSRQEDEPNYDLGWERDGVVFVAEGKSITDAKRRSSSASASARCCAIAGCSRRRTLMCARY